MIRNGVRSLALLLMVLVGRSQGLHSDAPDLKVGPTIRAATPSAQTDLTGTWNASFDSQIGRQDYTYQFQLQEKKLTGKASSANGESEIRNGQVEGNTVTFVENFNYQGVTIVITYNGTIVSPDEIRFMRQVGEFATEELVARRVKP